MKPQIFYKPEKCGCTAPRKEYEESLQSNPYEWSRIGPMGRLLEPKLYAINSENLPRTIGHPEIRKHEDTNIFLRNLQRKYLEQIRKPPVHDALRRINEDRLKTTYQVDYNHNVEYTCFEYDDLDLPGDFKYKNKEPEIFIPCRKSTRPPYIGGHNVPGIRYDKEGFDVGGWDTSDEGNKFSGSRTRGGSSGGGKKSGGKSSKKTPIRKNRPVGGRNQPTGGRNQTSGDRNQLSGDRNQPSDEKNQPSGESNQPLGEKNQPSGETYQPSGENNELTGKKNQPSGEKQDTISSLAGRPMVSSKPKKSNNAAKQSGTNEAAPQFIEMFTGEDEEPRITEYQDVIDRTGEEIIRSQLHNSKGKNRKKKCN